MLLMTEKNANEERQRFQRDYHVNARAVRKLRSRARMTLGDLARRSDVHYTTINRIERGHNRSPHWPTLEQLADALKVHVDDIVIYDDPIPDEPDTTAENDSHIDQLRREQDWRDDQERGAPEREPGNRAP